MTRPFIVGFSDSAIEDIQLTVVHAHNAEHALDKFAQVIGIHEPKFLEYVYDRSEELSFAENFWLATEEEQEEYERSKTLLIDEAEFRRRVKEFFGQNQDYAERYLQYYFGDEEPRDDLFPEEMLLYIWFEAEWAEVLVVPLEELPVIQ